PAPPDRDPGRAEPVHHRRRPRPCEKGAPRGVRDPEHRALERGIPLGPGGALPGVSMPRFLIALAVLATACNSPLGEADSGPLPLACLQPLDGGVFLTGLTAPVPGCSAPQRDAGVFGLDTVGWQAGGVL